MQVEKLTRAKRSLEQELTKTSTENERLMSKENSIQDDLHRRLCSLEAVKEQLARQLEARDHEIRQTRQM